MAVAGDDIVMVIITVRERIGSPRIAAVIIIISLIATLTTHAVGIHSTTEEIEGIDMEM